jgi:hypothetical protein
MLRGNKGTGMALHRYAFPENADSMPISQERQPNKQCKHGGGFQNGFSHVERSWIDALMNKSSQEKHTVRQADVLAPGGSVGSVSPPTFNTKADFLLSTTAALQYLQGKLK